MRQKYLEIFNNINALIRYHQNCGIGDYCRNDDLDQFMLMRQNSTLGSLGRNQTVHAQSDEIQRTDICIADVHKEITACSACDLATRKQLSTTGRGGEKARLFIVGEWLSVDGNVNDREELIFGQEEDLMLSRMIAALNLNESDTFVTNLVKCSMGVSDGSPSRENFLACLSFLHRQINLVRPEVICVMGATAARVLLKSNRSLSQLRGQFYPYKEGISDTIPLMPTYHPSFLMKNKEMKKVAWVDLQAIGKKLGEKNVRKS